MNSVKDVVPFEVMRVLFDLDERDEDFNRVLLRSAHETGKKVLPIAARFDSEGNCLIMLAFDCGNKVFDVEYAAGYDAETIPAPLVEAVTKLFEHKR